MSNEIVSPPRVGGLHETILNPAGCVDTEMRADENRFAPLSNETEDSPSNRSSMRWRDVFTPPCVSLVRRSCV